MTKDEAQRRRWIFYEAVNLVSDEMELTILVPDSQGNRSEPIKLPLRFNLGARQEVPETWADADKHRLGAIMINIETSQRYSSR